MVLCLGWLSKKQRRKMPELAASVNFEMAGGAVVPDTREDLAGAVRSLPDGWYSATIRGIRRGHTSTRYKYYFAHVVETILLTCSHHFQVMEGDSFRPARSPAEIHEVLKLKYNPVMIKTPFGAYFSSGTTTNLTDRQFIQQFEEAIVAEFSSPPYGCDFMGREEWAAWMKERKGR